jgi:hypothetical protein
MEGRLRLEFRFKPIQSRIDLIEMLQDIPELLVMLIKSLLDSIKAWFDDLTIPILSGLFGFSCLSGWPVFLC